MKVKLYDRTFLDICVQTLGVKVKSCKKKKWSSYVHKPFDLKKLQIEKRKHSVAEKDVAVQTCPLWKRFGQSVHVLLSVR